MNIDKNFIEQVVQLLKTAPVGERDIQYLQDKGIDVNSERFFEHYKFMLKSGIIETENGVKGYSLSHDGTVAFSAIPLNICD